MIVKALRQSWRRRRPRKWSWTGRRPMRGNRAAGMRVAVAGGSIGGLAAATALRYVGCAVEVLSCTPHQMTSRGASIVLAALADGALCRKWAGQSLPTTRCTHRNYSRPTVAAAS